MTTRRTWRIELEDWGEAQSAPRFHVNVLRGNALVATVCGSVKRHVVGDAHRFARHWMRATAERRAS